MKLGRAPATRSTTGFMLETPPQPLPRRAGGPRRASRPVGENDQDSTGPGVPRRRPAKARRMKWHWYVRRIRAMSVPELAYRARPDPEAPRPTAGHAAPAGRGLALRPLAEAPPLPSRASSTSTCPTPRPRPPSIGPATTRTAGAPPPSSTGPSTTATKHRWATASTPGSSTAISSWCPGRSTTARRAARSGRGRGPSDPRLDPPEPAARGHQLDELAGARPAHPLLGHRPGSLRRARRPWPASAPPWPPRWRSRRTTSVTPCPSTPPRTTTSWASSWASWPRVPSSPRRRGLAPTPSSHATASSTRPSARTWQTASIASRPSTTTTTPASTCSPTIALFGRLGWDGPGRAAGARPPDGLVRRQHGRRPRAGLRDRGR